MKIATHTKKVAVFTGDEIVELLRSHAARALNCSPADLVTETTDRYPSVTITLEKISEG